MFRVQQLALACECLSKLRQLAMLTSVTLTWIPGHPGIQGNEKADALTRQGAQRDFIGPEPCLPIERIWYRRKLLTQKHLFHKYTINSTL